MDVERLKQIEEIYHAALEVSPAKREAFIKKNCGNDEDLRREIESLLKFEKTYDSFIDLPPEKFAADYLSENENDAQFENKSSLIGKQINQYRILSKIGEGGMGTVFLAKDTRLERQVAVKSLSAEFSGDETRRNRFFQEAKSASALNHPNILTVHEIGEFEGTHFIVTEYIKGKTLKEFLKEEKPQMPQILEIAAQIASALTAAHEAGIIHRDIKPDNLMVRKDGLVKILDFGISKLQSINNTSEIDAEAATQLKPETMPGMIIGTPQYMSPEQARGQKIDLRSDIFSFGVVLYEMLAGKPPFTGTTNMDIIGAILKDEPAPLHESVPEISTELEHIVEKTLRKDREERYQNIKDLLIDLRDAKKTLEFKTQKIHHTDSEKSRVTIEETSSMATQARFSFVHILLFLLILSGTVGGIYWFSAMRTAKIQNLSELKNAEVANWSSSPGEVYTVGSFSPDAKMVAFASTKSGSNNIWVKQTASGEAVPITKDDSQNKNPIWSPNGEEIAFYSRKGNQGGIWRMPSLSGSAVFVTELSDASSQLKFWSKENLIYYELKNEIFTVDVNSGEKKQVSRFVEKNIKPTPITPSRDEKRLGYVLREEKNYTLWISDLAGNEPQQIFSSPNAIRNVVWHTDNQRILFSSQIDGVFQIFETDIYGNPPQQITNAESDNLVLDVSSDGTKVLFGSAKETSDVWGVNLKDSKEFAVASDIDSELWADASPDGKTIAYQSIKNLSQGNKLFNGNILTKTFDEKNNETVLALDASLPQWSPDGKMLAFMRFNNGKFQIETIRSTGGGQKNLISEDVSSPSYSVLPYNRLQFSNFRWSPDSRKIAYISDQSGQSNIWLADTLGSSQVQLTANDSDLRLHNPLWSADGKRIAYRTQSSNTEGKPIFGVSIIDAETKENVPLFEQNSFIRLVGWSASGKELIFASNEKGQGVLPEEITLFSLSVEGKKKDEIAKLKETYLHNIHLSFDKKTIAFVAHRDGKDNVWIIPATGGEAKKLTDNDDSQLYFSSLAWSPDGNHIFFGKQSRFSLLSMLTNFK